MLSICRRVPFIMTIFVDGLRTALVADGIPITVTIR
jgi:hypothetical protein